MRLAAVDPVTWDVATWDAGTWITAASPAVAVVAVVVAVLARLDSRRSSRAAVDSASAAQRSADAAERATALQEREADLRAADRHEAAGPEFVPVEDAVVDDDSLTAQVRLRIEGGPGAVELELRSTGVAWCSGLSSTGAQPSGTVLVMAREPGDVVTVVAHLTGRPWVGEDHEILPVVVTAQTQDLRQQWVRRVSVPVVPAPPPPQVAFLSM